MLSKIKLSFSQGTLIFFEKPHKPRSEHVSGNIVYVAFVFAQIELGFK